MFFLSILGEKSSIFWFRTYLIIVTKESPSWSTNSADMSKVKEEKNILTIFDVHNKFIAYSAPIKPLRSLASEWGLLFGLGLDNKIFHLVEKDIKSKLDLLFKKNFYDIAIKIAKSHHYDSEDLVDIFRLVDFVMSAFGLVCISTCRPFNLSAFGIVSPFDFSAFNVSAF
jgi:hypothetical protein